MRRLVPPVIFLLAAAVLSSAPLARYPVQNENSVSGARPDNGLGARSAPKETGPTSQGAPPGISRGGAAWRVQTISYRDARPVLESLRRDLLPDDLRSKTAAEIEAAWSDWVARRDRATRGRLDQGDRDSIVNFLLFGTTFTRAPRATAADLAALNERPQEALSLLTRRVDDLAAAVAEPRSNERLQFARRFLERHGMQPHTAAGRA